MGTAARTWTASRATKPSVTVGRSFAASGTGGVAPRASGGRYVHRRDPADYPDLERDDLLAALEFAAIPLGTRRVDAHLGNFPAITPAWARIAQRFGLSTGNGFTVLRGSPAQQRARRQLESRESVDP